jgi:hypothetical protein
VLQPLLRLAESNPVALFFFHLIGSQQVILDDQGTELPDVKAAEAHALRIVRELGRNSPAAHAQSISVTDARGTEVARVPMPSK